MEELNQSPLSLHAALNHRVQLKTAIDEGADVTVYDVDGDRTPLHWAAARGWVKCVAILLAAGASPGAVDASGRTPAQLAEEFGQVEVGVIFARTPLRIGSMLSESSTDLDEISEGASSHSLSSPRGGATAMINLRHRARVSDTVDELQAA